MANFPTSLDNLLNPNPNDSTIGHANLHAQVNDILEAIQAKVGINNSTEPTSLDYRINSLENSVVHKTGDESISGVKTFEDKISLVEGDGSSGYVMPQIEFQFYGGGYRHFLHTRHNLGTGSSNAIDFYTSDGTPGGTFPTNAIHGMTIENGKVGIGTTTPTAELDVKGVVKSYQAGQWWNGRFSAYQDNTSGWLFGKRGDGNKSFSFQYQDNGIWLGDTLTFDTSGNFTFNNQNWTSAWTSYTPTIGDGTNTATITVNSASYKIIGKNLFIQNDITINNKNSCAGVFKIFLPLGLTTPVTTALSGQYKGGNATGTFLSYANYVVHCNSATDFSERQWSSVTNGDRFIFSGLITIN